MKDFLNFLQSLFTNSTPVTKPDVGPGALLDIRTDAETALDYVHEEIALGGAVVWKEKTPFEWRSFPVKDQDGSSSCVGNAVALALGIENYLEEGEYVELSARDLYAQRYNKPAEGSYFPNLMDIASKKGSTLESLMPSNGKSEATMNNDSDRKVSYNQIARVFKAGGYFQIANITMDSIAGMVAQGKGVVVGFKFSYDEWTENPTIKTSNPTLGHAVVVVDYCLVGGKKYLIIQDSWGLKFAISGRRMISEEFLLKRCFYAAYFKFLRNDALDNPKPKYDGTTVVLQDCLKYEGLMPNNIGPSTDFYGPLTRKSVKAFQVKYNLPVNLNGDLNPDTEAKLRTLYA